MRLTELSLERYGCYIKRDLSFPDGAGLTVVYGPNEAGKSTCLAAVGDFLYAIPNNTARGSMFGYSGMRIGASMRLSDGRSMTLLRRKGHGKTLSDLKGTAYDETVLAAILGPVTQDRFSSLFGLDHKTLRSGGDRLLSAQGDIGRLIVEAGGGLRALVGSLKKIDDEADGLFGKTKKQSRAFYQGRTAYDTAEREVKAHLVSQDAYKETINKLETARRALSDLRRERQALAAKKGVLDRVQRVAPRLRERDELLLARADYADTRSYPEEFSKKARDALAGVETAKTNHDGAVERLERLKARVDSLAVDVGLSAAEKVIRSLSERALVVSKARGDRRNREKEIDADEGKLETLKRRLRLPADADLAERLPGPEAVELVQTLANAAIERSPKLEAAEERVSELVEKLRLIEDRIRDATEKGYDRSLGVVASQFGGVTMKRANLDARQRNWRSDVERIKKDLEALGPESVEELASLCCPAPDQVRDEQAAREAVRNKRLDQERFNREAAGEIENARTEAAALQAGGVVATDAAVAAARANRDERWRPIRDAFVEGRVDGTRESRQDAAVRFESLAGESDALSDRRAVEAGRVAALEGWERRIAEAERKMESADRELAALAAALAEREAAFATAYPDICRMRPALGAMLDFSTKRADLLLRDAAARKSAEEIAVEEAELKETLDVLEGAERKFGFDGGGALAARVQAAQAAIAEREKRRADLTRDLRDRQESSAALNEATKKRDELRAARREWEAAWPGAVDALSLPAEAAPAAASKIATEWAGARGVLGSIRRTRARLQSIDGDETQLRKAVAETAGKLAIEVADDAVAAAQMLQKRWDDNEARRVQRDGLKPEMEEAKVAARAAEGALTGAKDALERLAAAAGVDIGGLELAATRFDARRGLESRIEAAERTAMDAGDGFSVAALKREWGDRDLDVIRASIEDAQGRLEAIDDDLRQANRAEKEAEDALAAFANEKEVNRAVVRRENAVADMHQSLERFLELSLASFAVKEAMAKVRADQQDPLVARAGVLFAGMTQGEFVGIKTDVGEEGAPVVVGRRGNGAEASIAEMSDGTRDQLFLAFRLASLESYGEKAEPLPFVADDILVHFDDARSKATLDLLATFGEKNQVLLFTHHDSVRDAAAELVKAGRAHIVELEKAA